MNGDLINKLDYGQVGGSIVSAMRLDAPLRCFPFSYTLDGEDVIPAFHGSGKVEKKKTLLALRGATAGDILDELQSWLDDNPEHLCRRKVLRLLVDISAASGELPRDLFIDGVLADSTFAWYYGGSADVYRGTYNQQRVAIKRLRFNVDSQPSVFRAFCKEGLIWRHLNHPNILPFLGIDGDSFKNTGRLTMVSPWMERGRQRLISEIAQGLHYLHECGFTHGDFHGGNVLITEDGHARLTDFGLTVIGDLTRSSPGTSPGVAGIARWLAPEVFSTESCKTKAGDVFAFGRMCLAICTTLPPFPSTQDHCVPFLLFKGVQPPRPTTQECTGYAISNVLWNLIIDCWKIVPEQRPTMKQILATLSSHPNH